MNKLFQPLMIKNTTIKNRIAVPPMVCFNWSDETGYVSQKHIDHYAAIARGGAGLIIQEATCITPTGRLSFDQLGIWEDGQIEGLRKITEAVHKEGCPIVVQIHHAGVVGVESEPVCPSDYVWTSKAKGRTNHGHGLTLDELHRIQQLYIDSAVRAWKAGFEGVELHGCHSYLISQFFNKTVNKREDDYGVYPEHFVFEIMDGIRKEVPEDFIIGIRLGGFEPTLADGIAHSKALDQYGIDFLDISYGFNQEEDTPADFPFADIIYAAQEIKKNVSCPVFAVQDIDSAEKAESVLEVTGVDMVDIGRGTLVNYQWAKDAQEGRNVGKCLHCPSCKWRIDPSQCPGRILLECSR